MSTWQTFMLSGRAISMSRVLFIRIVNVLQEELSVRSDQYEFYCCYCRHGDDIFRDAISHVIYSHKHQVIRLGQRSEKKEADRKSGPLLFIRQWDVIPNSVLSDGRTIKVNKETEQLEICEPVYKA
uniref:Uncharacterized protein LOC111125034 isoform X1 n=1 Tax=Crassostrea virginica TaxID=6565 RepID=A0A8B8D9F4_CRAVI|nr:uncharacterized protein LOC111125034 isoform X1 [Crassostrea virginica]